MENDDIITLTVEQLCEMLKKAWNSGAERGVIAIRGFKSISVDTEEKVRSQCVESLIGQIL